MNIIFFHLDEVPIPSNTSNAPVVETPNEMATSAVPFQNHIENQMEVDSGGLNNGSDHTSKSQSNNMIYFMKENYLMMVLWY